MVQATQAALAALTVARYECTKYTFLLPPAPKPAATAGAELPRLFEGTLSSTRSPLHPRRPYDFELLDSNGVRYAYLDFTSLPPTEQPGRFVGSVVVIYGIAKPVSGIADMVIEAETVRSR